MEERLQNIRDSLQDALDELSSARSSSEAKTRALHRIERHLAAACIPKDSSEDLDSFNALQYTFECNVPMRLLAWISASTYTLEALTNKGTMDPERELQASRLSSQLSLSLSLMQASRHLSTPTPPSTDTPSRTAAPAAAPLSSVVLDTLLCILVDAPAALRAFEDASGTQAVVKILKRAGTPREVRMKCLEFLYFYLLDENGKSPEEVAKLESPVPTPPPTIPNTPMKPSKPYLNGRPLRPSSSRFGSSEVSFPSNKASSSSSLNTPRSTSGSSTNSFSSTSSNASGSTAPSSPDKPTLILPPKTPPTSPRLAHKVPQQLQPRSLMMLRREVDYEPQSPKKAQASRLGVTSSRHSSSKSIASTSRSRLASEDDCRRYSQVSATPSRHDKNEGAVENEPSRAQSRAEKTRTIEEKKELLGTMLGNVDALVEGVRKAGIWGLG
ncbi:hypothetical protein DXG01_006673 [Tephrocybe rancida]|nr:hypothetical protein DXG01_006673 [Tephrocybe rancida]